MCLIETLAHLQKARKILSDGQRDLLSQRKLVHRLEQRRLVHIKDLLLLEQLETMQLVYIQHVNKLEDRLLQELRINDAEDA
jgi:hypothetical protein